MDKIITDIETLRKVSKDTTLKECKKLDIFKRLEDSLKDSKTPGVGLSAIQIGIPIKANIIRIPKSEYSQGVFLNMFNPRITEFSQPIAFTGERCLSLPGRQGTTKRYKQVTLEYNDEEGKERKGSFYGFEAVVVQHETDHNEGVLFTDKLIKSDPIIVNKIGRNEPCPCKSGKKYKKCCLGKEK